MMSTATNKMNIIDSAANIYSQQLNIIGTFYQQFTLSLLSLYYYPQHQLLQNLLQG